jgi:tetratricopeptide (TPR) repeat protein
MSPGDRAFPAAATLAALAVFMACVAARAQAPWVVPEARIRAVVRLGVAPENLDAGEAIEVPPFGAGPPDAGGYSLTDAAGRAVPVAVVYQAPELNTILLARGLEPEQTYYLYIGAKPGLSWVPKTSVLFETRRSNAPRGEVYASFGALESAWNAAAGQSGGARFAGQIYSGENPFGDQTQFLSHFSAYLAPAPAEMEIFSNSSDSSFVLVNGQYFTDWTGNASANATDKSLRSKKLPASSEPVKVDYYQFKGSGDAPPNMTLGWRKPGGHLALVPGNAFLHAGGAAVERYEAQDGGPVPAPVIEKVSYIGYGNAFLYLLRCRLAPTDLQGADVEWRFNDGAVLAGPDITRVISGFPGTQHLTVSARRGDAGGLQVVRRLGFYGTPPPEAAGGEEEGPEAAKGHARYVALLMELDPSKLDPSMLAAALPLLLHSGTDAEIAAYADAWLALKPALSDPLWLPAFSARIRSIAQANPQAALAEITAHNAARQLYGQQLDLLELEIRVFAVHAMAELPRVQQLAFSLGPEAGKLGEIRVGDLYRLNGNVDQAIVHYQAAQPPDHSNGRQLPAEDQANAMTVEDLLENGTREETAAKLDAWELAHPMAKFTTNFLVLRARLLELDGRWREALSELDAFPASHPDSPYEIDVDFYRARALSELGRKDEARKIWRDIARQYPKSELAEPSRKAAEKP